MKSPRRFILNFKTQKTKINQTVSKYELSVAYYFNLLMASIRAKNVTPNWVALLISMKKTNVRCPSIDDTSKWIAVRSDLGCQKNL